MVPTPPVGAFHAPLADALSPHPRRMSGPSEPSVPFQNGAGARPDRDADPVPWALESEDPEDFMAVDARDSMVEGMWLTPGMGPYASAWGDSPDANTAGPGEDLGRRLRRTPLGPSVARNLFGNCPRGPPRRPKNLRSNKGGSAHPDGNCVPVDDMDEDEWNDGGGPSDGRRTGARKACHDQDPRADPTWDRHR